MKRLFLFLCVPAVCFAAGLGVLLASMPRVSDGIDAGWGIPALIFVGSLLGVLVVLLVGRWRGDAALLAGVFLLAGLGLLVQARMVSEVYSFENLKPFLPYGLGVVGFALAAVCLERGRCGGLRVLSWPSYGLMLAVLAGMLVVGQRFRGGLYVQGFLSPTEVVKPLAALFLAGFLSKGKGAPSWRELLVLGCLWVPVNGLVLLHRDFGLLVVLDVLFVAAVFAASGQVRWLVLGAVGICAASVAVPLMASHAAVRFEIWRDPFGDPTGKGWQLLQGLSAMYAGGLFGAGLGGGSPQFVPIVTSDFVYAALAEEVGFAGCVGVLAVYAAVAWRGLAAAAAQKVTFVRLFGVGLVTVFAGQALLNIGGVVKAIPMTGITLPLISHGGSSLVVSFVLLGIIAAMSDE